MCINYLEFNRKQNKRNYILCGALITLNVLDYITTYTGIEKLGLVEANPYSSYFSLGFKIILTAFLIVPVYLNSKIKLEGKELICYSKINKAYMTVLSAVTIFYILVITNNLILIFSVLL